MVHDFRMAVRSLRRSPGFTAAVIVLLAVGTGANTSIYALLDRLLVQAPPVIDPQHLVLLQRGDGQATFPFIEARRIEARVRTLDGLATVLPFESDLAVTDAASVVTAEAVSGSYGDVIRPRMQAGRWFTRDDEPEAVISASAWARWFNRDANVLGRTVQSQTQTYTIVGVAAPEFSGVLAPLRTDIWIPGDVWARQLPEAQQDERRRPAVMLFGRLRGDVSIEQATAELRVIDAQLAEEPSTGARNQGPLLVSRVRGVWQPDIRRTSQAGVTMLAAIVGLVLALACVNVGNLLLVRGAARQREMAIRHALGASRARMFRQSLAETFVLAALGAAGGVAIAWGTNRLLGALIPALPFAFPFELALSINARALGFTVAIALMTTLACGLAPAWRVARTAALPALKGDTRSPSQIRGRTVATILQVTVSLVLLLVAGSFIRQIVRLQDRDAGFAYEDVLYATTFVPDRSLSGDGRRQLYTAVIDRIRAHPAVLAASRTFLLPLSPGGDACLVDPSGDRVQGSSSLIDVGFLSTMGIRLVAGRDFAASDAEGGVPAVIVSNALARRFWPDGSAVGQRLRLDCDAQVSADVIGVARDTATRSLGSAPEAHVYRLLPPAYAGLTTLVVKSRLPAAAMVQPLRTLFQEFATQVRVYEVGPVADHVARSYWGVRWSSRVLGVFAGVALGLAVLGLYGVISYRVTRRTRDIGVRLALGAAPGRIVADVVRQGLTLASIGVALGLAITVAIARLLARSALDVAPPDLATYLAVSLAWCLATLAACSLPAWRAACIDPVQTLRTE